MTLGVAIRYMQFVFYLCTRYPVGVFGKPYLVPRENEVYQAPGYSSRYYTCFSTCILFVWLMIVPAEEKTQWKKLQSGCISIFIPWAEKFLLYKIDVYETKLFCKVAQTWFRLCVQSRKPYQHHTKIQCRLHFTCCNNRRTYRTWNCTFYNKQIQTCSILRFSQNGYNVSK